jgi:hypothetical protein
MEHPESDEPLSEVPATEESKSESNEPLRKRRRGAIYLAKGSDEEKKVLDIGATFLLESVTEDLESGGLLVVGEEDEQTLPPPPPRVESEEAELASNKEG